LSTTQAGASEFTTSDEMSLKLLIRIVEKHSNQKLQSDPSEALIATQLHENSMLGLIGSVHEG
jgi:hypothetical protein